MRLPLLLALAAACTPPASDTLVDVGNPIDDTLDWEPCSNPDLLCATLPVSDGVLDVVRMPAIDPSGEVIVLAAGGPGGSSTNLLRARAANATGAMDVWRQDHDLVAVDPRGVGARSIECVDSSWYDRVRLYDPAPEGEADRAALGLLRDEFVAGCAAELTADQLLDLGTETAADDLEELRLALEVDALSFIGASYGTWLGAVYATRYPETTDHFVLDAVVGPEPTRDGFLAGQAAGFEHALGRFFDWCDAEPECGLDDAAATYDALLAATPIPVPSDPDGRHITRNELRWVATNAMYSMNGWRWLADTLVAADAGDVDALMAAADASWGRDPSTGETDTIFARYLAIGCIDQPWPDGWTDDDVFDFGLQLDQLYPRIGAALITGEIACQGWPVRQPAFSVADSEAPPMLLVAGRHDPATPWDGTVDTLETLDNGSHLLTWEGDGHGALWRNDCTFWSLTDFLLDGTPPGVDECEP